MSFRLEKLTETWKGHVDELILHFRMERVGSRWVVRKLPFSRACSRKRSCASLRVLKFCPRNGSSIFFLCLREKQKRTNATKIGREPVVWQQKKQLHGREEIRLKSGGIRVNFSRFGSSSFFSNFLTSLRRLIFILFAGDNLLNRNSIS